MPTIFDTQPARSPFTVHRSPFTVYRSPPVPVKKIIEYILKIRISCVYLHVFVIQYSDGKEKIKITG